MFSHITPALQTWFAKVALLLSLFSYGGEIPDFFDDDPIDVVRPVDYQTQHPFRRPIPEWILDVKFWLYVAALFPILYFSACVHELGHYTLGRLNGITITSCGMGIARPLFIVPWGQTKFYLALTQPFQGITFLYMPEILPARFRVIAALAGGMLAQAVLAMCVFTISQFVPWGHGFCLFVVWVNVVTLSINAVPLKLKIGTMTLRSDGAQIVELLRFGTWIPQPTGQVQGFKTASVLFRSIGDNLGYFVHALMTASGWSDMGDQERALQLCDEARAQLQHPSPIDSALLALTRSRIALLAGDREESERNIAEAEVVYRECNHRPGLLEIQLLQTEHLLQSGDPSGALSRLDALQSDPLVASRRSVQIALLHSRISIQAALGNEDRVEESLAQLAVLRRNFPSITSEVRVHHSLARFYAGRGNWSRAETEYRTALKAVGEIYQSLPDMEDRDRYRRCQSALLGEAGDCLMQLGKEEESAKLADMFPTTEDLHRRTVEANLSRPRKIHKAGWLLTWLNLLVAACFLVGFADWSRVLHYWEQGNYLVAVLLGCFALERRHAQIALCVFICAVLQFVKAGIDYLFSRPMTLSRAYLTVWVSVLPWLLWLYVF